ncbi:xanthine dehydrogenase family protein subunit M [Granulicella sp. L46]|uniref:FAD binding domain-containing protein n=1 Tax=Granulicella sp. L46 TaxID=1641865 RepID=UPI00131E5280|nr:xanthine dehydrogenase family protein subunit M [Granulicella sp. L46]
MQPFQFTRATTPEQAIHAHAGAAARFVAGGTNLIDMMKLDVERPSTLIDINELQLSAITPTPGGGLHLGALSRNSEATHHPTVLRDYPVLSQAILSGASPQLRNMASTAGNLLQRTRCVYFRDTAFPCNKREPGSGCSAIEGFNRNLAILGTSKDCIATNPSDQNVALTALEATIHVQGPSGKRDIAIHDFYVVPGTTPQIETVLQPGDLITGVTLPPPRAGIRSVYLKLRDREAYEFALASAAVQLGTQGNRITFARVALGGVGTKPWRSLEAERALEGHSVDLATFRHAAQEAIREAHPQSENAFKVDLSQRCLVRALTLATKSA